MPSVHPLSDLLPIPKGVTKPNAYHVFGIDTATQDEESIQATIQSVIAELKSVKTKTDSKRWKAAARLASDAKKLLADPKQREKLNKSMLVTAGGGNPSAPATESTTDPLAGLLPDADPLRKFEPNEQSDQLSPPAEEQLDADAAVPDLPASITPTDREQVAIPEIPVPQPPRLDTVTPEISASEISSSQLQGLTADSLLPPDSSLLPNDLLTSMESSTTGVGDNYDPEPISVPSFEDSTPSFGSNADVMVKKPQNRSRRRRSKTGMLIPAIFAIACFGIVGVVLFIILNKPGVRIAMSEDGVVIQDGTEDLGNQPQEPVQEQKPRSTQPRDPVMGGLGPDSNNQNPDPNAPKVTDPIAEPDGNQTNQASPSMPNEKPNGNGMNQGATGNADPEPNSPQTATPEKPTSDDPAGAMKPNGDDPPMESLSEEVLQKAEETLQAAKSAILSADWNQMNAIANRMLDQPMSDEQKSEAGDLFQVIDLALFYRTAIVDSVANLNVGNDFEVSDGLRVIIVEKSPSNLIVMFNKMQREYSIDQLPWPLAHKLASFEVSGDTFSTAAKSVYQAIAPTTNSGLQTQALDWIEEIQNDLDGTDKENVGSTLSSLIANP